MGNAAEAERLYREILAAAPDYVPALSLLGVLCSLTARKLEALGLMQKAARLGPNSAPALLNYAILLQEMDRGDEALAYFSRVTALQPGNALAHAQEANLLVALKRLPEALTRFNKAIALKPDFTAALGNRGIVLRQLGRADEAMADFDKALALAPDNTLMLAARGYLHWDKFRRLEPAVRDLERAVALHPDADYARGDLMHMKMLGGDWRGFATELALIDAGVRAGKKIIRPFAYQALSGSPEDLQTCAVTWTRDAVPPAPALWQGERYRHGKIRVGYVCGSFSKHALAYLAAGLYELHDRSGFEIFAFDTGRSDNSRMRARLESAFDKFISIAEMSDGDAAKKIRAEEIDILVNVDGYSGTIRMGVFARRPAPMQVNWLGYPGTLGADYMDYIIADPVVIPPDDARHYTEEIVTMPHAYQVNDARRAIAAQSPGRAALGLPPNGFVFCNFNQSYKLTPDIFACWMRLLARVEGSVLWLLEANQTFHANLRAAAEKEGISGARLIFAPIIPIEDHLARLRLADLFLDTLPYNAHTTASDALWAGLPLLTCRGQAFAGRVAASLLLSMDMPELVASNMNDYERLALKLAHEPLLLQSLRDKIAANRPQSPLFNTDLYRRQLESAYRTMMEQASRGEAARAFRVETG